MFRESRRQQAVTSSKRVTVTGRDFRPRQRWPILDVCWSTQTPPGMDGRCGEHFTSQSLPQCRGCTCTSCPYHPESWSGKGGLGQGACVGDYDNDGDPQEDLFVTYYGHSVLDHNEGNGRLKTSRKRRTRIRCRALGHRRPLRLRPRRQARWRHGTTGRVQPQQDPRADNDGRKDIVMVNGHVYPEVENVAP